MLFSARVSRVIHLFMVYFSLFVAVDSWSAIKGPAVRDFVEAIDEEKASTVGSALKLLPDEMKRRFTLMHGVRDGEPGGKAFQEAHPDCPRAILFGWTGKLIATFNCDESKRGGYSIETVESLPSGRIQFREIIFKGNLPENVRRQSLKVRPEVLSDYELEPADVEAENERILVSKPNPEKCLRCHSVNSNQYSLALSLPHEERLAKFNWDPYKRWRGAYGEDDDKIGVKDERLVDFIRFKYFVAPKNPRYSVLKFGPKVASPFYLSEQRTENPLKIRELLQTAFGEFYQELLSKAGITDSVFYKHTTFQNVFTDRRTKKTMVNSHLTTVLSVKAAAQGAFWMEKNLDTDFKSQIIDKICSAHSNSTLEGQSLIKKVNEYLRKRNIQILPWDLRFFSEDDYQVDVAAHEEGHWGYGGSLAVVGADRFLTASFPFHNLLMFFKRNSPKAWKSYSLVKNKLINSKAKENYGLYSVIPDSKKEFFAEGLVSNYKDNISIEKFCAAR